MESFWGGVGTDVDKTMNGPCGGANHKGRGRGSRETLTAEGEPKGGQGDTLEALALFLPTG